QNKIRTIFTKTLPVTLEELIKERAGKIKKPISNARDYKADVPNYDCLPGFMNPIRAKEDLDELLECVQGKIATNEAACSSAMKAIENWQHPARDASFK